MTKISLIPNALDATTVLDKTKIQIPVVDIQTNPPGSADNYRAGLDSLQWALSYELLNVTAHGLVAGDVGKPLYDTAIYDDTDSSQFAMWLLAHYVDVDQVIVAPPGSIVDIPVTLIEDGNGYDVAVKGRELYWDESATMYVSTQPGDSARNPILHVISVSTSTFRAVLVDGATNGMGTSPSSATIVTVVGTGDTATDASNLSSAAAILNGQGGGILRIDGTVRVSAPVIFTTSVSVEGIPGTEPTLEYHENAGYLGWNSNFNGITQVQSGTAITATSAFASELEVPETVLTAGDWFLVSSEDNITGVTLGTATTALRPIELHQVKEIRTNTGGTDYVIFDDFVVDALTTTPKVKQIDMIEGVTVKGLTFTWTGTTPSGFPSLDFRTCNNLRVHDCHWAHDGPNEALFLYCSNVLVHSISIGPKRAYDTGEGYGVVIGTCNRFTWADSTASGCRHVFTTTAQSQSTIRYGQSRNCLITNVQAVGSGIAGDPGSSLVPFDTHESGWRIIFDGCRVSVPYERQSYPSGTQNTNRGFQSRSRETIFRNCSVDSMSGLTSGFLIRAANNQVLNCTMNGGWKGVEVSYDTVGTTNGVNGLIVDGFIHTRATQTSGRMVYIGAGDNHCISHCTMIGEGTGALRGIDILDEGDDPPEVTISHCKFKNLKDSGVALRSTGIIAGISYCEFDDVGNSASYEESCIHIEGTSTASINHCNLVKDSNVYSISGTTFGTGNITAVGNNLTGYVADATTEATGVDATNANSSAIDTYLAANNWPVAITPGAASTGYDLATDFGVTLNGVTDDITNLRTAIANSDNPLYIPEGTALISKTLSIPEGKVVYGAGRKTIIKGNMTDGTPIVSIGGLGNYTADDINNEIDATSHGLNEGQVVRFYGFTGQTAGAPEGGMGQGATFYVRNPTDNTFQISTTKTGGLTTITSAAGTGTTMWYASNSAHCLLKSITIEGTGAAQNAVGLAAEGSSRYAIEDVLVNATGTGVHLGDQQTAVPGFGGWVLDVRNLFITNCDYCLSAKQVNASRVQVLMENSSPDPTQYFHISNCNGTQFTIMAEGRFQSTFSTIDDCTGTSFDGMWLEHSGDSPYPTMPLLKVGSTTMCSGLSMRGISVSAGTLIDTAVEFDRLDGATLSGVISASGFGNEWTYTSNSVNIDDQFQGSAGYGASLHRFGMPVEINQLPTTNYFHDPFFEKGLPTALAPPDAAHRVQLTGTNGDTGVVAETTTVLPGKTRSMKVIANASQQNARLIIEVPLVGELASLKGKVATVGYWIYAPATYYDIGAEATVYPYCKLIVDGTGGHTSANYNATQHIPDNWCFAVVETADGSTQTAIPTDASFIKLDFWLQNSGAQSTVSGQHIFIGGIVIAPGGSEMLGRLRKGNVQDVPVRHDYSAAGTPGTGDDAADLWGVGSIWSNGTNVYMCVDPTAGSADWKQLV